MPFTPYHLGPGAVFKAVGGRRFSFLLFGISQVAIDLEVLARIHAHVHPTHHLAHSLLGATCIGVPVVLLGKPLCQAWIALWNRAVQAKPEDALHVPPITWTAAVITVAIGLISHLALDSIVHPDIRFWWPIAEGCGLCGLATRATVFRFCVLSGQLGVIALVARYLWERHSRLGQ